MIVMYTCKDSLTPLLYSGKIKKKKKKKEKKRKERHIPRLISKFVVFFCVCLKIYSLHVII